MDSEEVLDDRKGIDEGFVEFFEEGFIVSFKKGLKSVKDYVLEHGGEDLWKEIETKLLALKEEVGEKGVWRNWGVEADWSLGVELK